MAKVLIVEDNAAERRSLERFLLDNGHAVCWAETGTSGLQALRIEHPDLLLLDMTLREDMSGWELAGEKRRDPSISSIPTIILTGLDPNEVRYRGKVEVQVLQEVQFIVGKPPDPRKLLRMIALLDAMLREVA